MADWHTLHPVVNGSERRCKQTQNIRDCIARGCTNLNVETDEGSNERMEITPCFVASNLATP
jgi:hypothetical protein